MAVTSILLFQSNSQHCPNVTSWQSKLRHHPPRQRLHEHILQGIEHGFGIGVHCLVLMDGVKNKMASARKHPAVIDAYLQE